MSEEDPICEGCSNPIDNCTCRCPYCNETVLCECCLGMRAVTGG